MGEWIVKEVSNDLVIDFYTEQDPFPVVIRTTELNRSKKPIQAIALTKEEARQLTLLLTTHFDTYFN